MNSYKNIVGAGVVALGIVAPSIVLADSHVRGAGFISIKAAKIKWADAPSIGPGAKVAVLEGDPKAAAPFTMRLRIPPNVKIGVHTHPAVERVTVLSGTFHFATGDKFDRAKTTAYRPGDGFIVPSGMPMYAFTGKEESILQLQAIGPWGIHYLDAADNPMKKK